ncbi:hypothetical protein TWF694_009798 [Orbilia ellipsospora]|uniref:PXA domain-containing protein n=1 Tax=Orbilia ellipsospora TaxID=2528407 RepID=A0AAV9XBX6_9PEZI
MPTSIAEEAGGPHPATSALPIPIEDSLVYQDEEMDSTSRSDAEQSALLSDTVDDDNTPTTILPEASAINTSDPSSNTKLRGGEQASILLEKCLSALSSASETTLIAGLSVIALLLSFMLGKVGLLVVGTILGAMLQAAIQSQNAVPEAVKSLVIRRDSEPKEEEEKEKVKEKVVHEDADFSALNPKVAIALDELCNSIIRDCINSWYLMLVPDDSSFSATCHQHLTQTFVRFSRHLKSKRPADVFVMSVFNISGTMMVFMRELSQALNGTRDIRAGIRTYISTHPKSQLSTMLHTGEQNKILEILASEMISQFAPRDLKNCEPVVTLLRNILRSVILGNMVERFSDPEFINEWIIHLLEHKGESGENKEGVSAVLQAFDRSVAGAAQRNLPKVSTSVPLETRSAGHSPKTRKENIRPASVQYNSTNGTANGAPILNGINDVNGVHRGVSPSPPQLPARMQPLETVQNESLLDEDRESFEEPKNSEDLPRGQYQRLENSAPHSPVSTSLKRSLSNASSAPSISELSMTPQKTSSESSRSEVYQPPPAEPKRPSVGLLNARVTVVDAGPTPNPSRILKTRPKNLFMIQLEPLDTAGRIVMRSYLDFENLHNTLLSIAKISGSNKYIIAYGEGLPTYKDRIIDEVVPLLELYLRIVLSEEHLVKTDVLFKFFEKDEDKKEREKVEKQERQEFSAPWRNSTINFDAVGKNILGTITKAPQAAGEGGKAFFGGIKKALTSQSPSQSPAVERGRETTRTPFSFMSNNTSRSRGNSLARQNEVEDSDASEKTTTGGRANSSMNGSPTEPAAQEPQRGRFSIQLNRWQSNNANPPLPPRRATSAVGARISSLQTIDAADEDLARSTPSLLEQELMGGSGEITMSFDEPSHLSSISLPPPPSEIDSLDARSEAGYSEYKPHIPPAAQWHEGITEQETQYVIESMFSVINELYGLSTAWMIRRSFLNIAKSVMLRPGNSQLQSMRTMIQSDVLQANTKPEVIADYIRQIRKNSLPTTAETAEWEKTKKPRTEEEKEELRRKARVLLSESLPQGLTALLGVNQTKEALYQLFDALQEKDIARGLWTAILRGTIEAVRQ